MPTESRLRTTTRHRVKFPVKIVCTCGQVGAATWEEDAGFNPMELRSIWIEVSSGFYLRARDKDSGRPEAVCSVCEKVVPL